MNNSSLNIICICKMFQSSLKEAGFFTQASDVGSVVMMKHFITQDSVCNLRCMQQVHLQETGLKGTMFRAVVLEGIEQKGSCLLNHVEGGKDINNCLQFNKWTTLIVQEQGSKFPSFVRIRTKNELKEICIIRLVAHFLGVENDLVVLTSFSKARYNLIINKKDH